MSSLTALPWDNKKLKIAVIGDVILDEYIDGFVNRISPEAPVPIHSVKEISHTAGGAGNAARNVALAGANVHLSGVCGNDEAAAQLKEILKKDGIDTTGLVTDNDRPTTRKTRVTSSHQQILRIDWEKTHEISKPLQDIVLEGLDSQDLDGILISDYGKGVLPSEFIQKIIQLAKTKGIPTVVDPKGVDYTKYQGADLIKPNYKESCIALGLDPSEEFEGKWLGEQLQSKFELSNILVTMGPKGMILVPTKESQEEVIYKRPEAKEVFDVSGAGDTVAALVTLGLTSGIKWDDTLHIASLGAGIVVEKWGTQPIHHHELTKSLHASPGTFDSTLPKIQTIESLQQILASKPLRSKKVVFTNGCFDILHAGHVTYLEAARSKGDILVVGINTDESISSIKGPSRPVVKLDNRMRTLAALEAVDYLVPFSDETPEKLIHSLRPNILLKGADWSVDDIVGGNFVQSYGGEVLTIPLVEGLSTSEIIRRAQNLPGE